jgi:hypothetical protein
MEFRQLMTAAERNIFSTRVEQARAAHGADFRASEALRAANQSRLEASRLYGLFEHPTAPAEEMIAGIAMHDLEAFPQSCSEPDLSNYVPRTVVECSDHWSLSSGAGMLAWAGLAMPMRLFGVKAVLAYLATGEKENEHAGFYSSMGFVETGSVVEHPFVQIADGSHRRVQPVLLYGAALETVIDAFARACIGFSDDARVFHLRSFVRPLVRRAACGRSRFVRPAVSSHSAQPQALHD